MQLGHSDCSRCGGGDPNCYVCRDIPEPAKAVLARRIATLQRDFGRAKTEGRDTSPFHRRARSLSAAYFAVMP